MTEAASDQASSAALSSEIPSSVEPRFVEQTNIDSGLVAVEISREYALDDEDSSKTFDGLTEQLQRCIPKVKKLYKSYSKYDARAQGSCLYKIVIDDGSVQDVLVDSTNIRSKEFVQTVQKLLKKTIVLKSGLKSVSFAVKFTLKDEALAEDLSGAFDVRELSGFLYGAPSCYEPKVNYPLNDSEYKVEKGSALSTKNLWQSVRDLTPTYESFLKKIPDTEGKVELKLVILPDGSVKTAEVVFSSTKSKKFDKAIVDEAPHWKFPKSFGSTTVSFPIEFLKGGCEKLVTKAHGVVLNPSEQEVSVSGSRNAADIMNIVKQRVPGLRHIYNKYLKKKPDFAGKIVLKLNIDSAGTVESAKVESSTTDFPEFEKIIEEQLGRWKFAPSNGTSMVTIPFTFAEKYPWSE